LDSPEAAVLFRLEAISANFPDETLQECVKGINIPAKSEASKQLLFAD
jgi:hypothetical protein